GNKTRKLEFVLAEAQAHGAQTLITVGAVQSNHCRQTAALAARFGLKCTLVLFGDIPQSPSGNYLLDRLFGAEIVWAERETHEEVLQDVFQRAWSEGQRPFLIPLGASTPTGAVAYAYAFKEFIEQGGEADWIVLASSSAGTQAGLVLGARLSRWPGRILGISVDHPADWVKARVAELATQAADRLGEIIRFSPDEIEVNDEYIGAGYGVMGEREIEAIRLFARDEGLLLDPVYTGRAAAGLIDLIRRGFFKPNERVLFWHTGGVPALFAERYAPNLL
ncbi:MAG: D-cysteine desulfhydrase family protein, partial [Thermanaerothrix sp.]|nr:D-cysteine desulfhydrase family protein [Thermanaerothrix sp.]